MLKKISLTLAGLLIAFVLFVSSKNGQFKYEKSGHINATAEKVFPYISQFKLGGLWSPYEKGIEMPKTYGGTEGQVGSWMDFGPSDSGSGRVEITEIVPLEKVNLNLHMTAPFEAMNKVTYQLTPEAEGVRFTWTMEGDGGFLGKLMTTLVDCETMIGGQFDQGIANLKAVAEKHP